MKEKIKKQNGFIQIPILITIIVSIVVASGVSYGVIKYHKTSSLIKEADQLTREEKYDEAIKKLETAQNNLFVKNLGLKRQEINNKIEINKRNLKDKLKFAKALEKIDERDYQGAIDLLFEIPNDSFYYQKAQTKIEEAKRKMLEEELSEEQIARKEAEAKAKQEEFEKKLKKQQLISKEAEERMMNTDNDGDGLTYRRELELGTSDFNVDSDGDGIKDNEDLHPAGGGRYQTQTFSWSYDGYNWKWDASIHEDWYEYYKAKPRVPHGVEYVTYNDPFIKEIAKKLSEAVREPYYLSKFNLAISFVQSLPYLSDVYTGYDDYPKYPVETFFEKNGDCEDLSYLTASILTAMNVGTTLILLPGHMAVGVLADCQSPGTYYKVGDGCYYYLETTCENCRVGEIPKEFQNTPATLIEVPSGEEFRVFPQYQPFTVGFFGITLNKTNF